MLAVWVVDTPVDSIDPNDGMTSLREAILASNSNNEDDTIRLGPGLHTIDIPGKEEDAGLTGDLDIAPDNGHHLLIEGDVGGTTIDARELDRVFEVHRFGNVTLRDLTLTNGSLHPSSTHQQQRGGLVRAAHSSLTIDRCRLTNSYAGNFGAGGAVYVAGGTWSITNTALEDNAAFASGSAVFARDAIGSMIRVDVRGNRAFKSDPSSRFDGGAVTVLGGSLDLRQARVDFNRSVGINILNAHANVDHIRVLGTEQRVGWNGDGLVFFNSTGQVHDSRFVMNEGHGLVIAGSDVAFNVTSSLFLSNRLHGLQSSLADVNLTDSLVQGNLNGLSGFQNTDQTLIVRRTEFRGNRANGIQATSGEINLVDSDFIDNSGAGMRLRADRIRLVNLQVDGNQRGGVDLASLNADIFNSTISNNRNHQAAAGIQLDPTGAGAHFRIVNSAIFGNEVVSVTPGSTVAGAINVNAFSGGSADVDVISSLITKNRTPSGAAVMAATNATVWLHMYNSIVWWNGSSDQSFFSGLAEITARHCVVYDGAAGDMDIPFGGEANGNTDLNPSFVDWANNDFRLRSHSVAIDAGSSAWLVTDIYDVDGDGQYDEFNPDLDFLDRISGGAVDIGPYEFFVLP